MQVPHAGGESGWEVSDVLEIRMQSRPGEGDPCSNCGEPSTGFHALPWFNGDLMSNDWPGEWGGLPCCLECFQQHESGKLPTFDHLYQHHLERRGMWIDGGGI